jgi:hypothetical protein
MWLLHNLTNQTIRHLFVLRGEYRVLIVQVTSNEDISVEGIKVRLNQFSKGESSVQPLLGVALCIMGSREADITVE